MLPSNWCVPDIFAFWDQCVRSSKPSPQKLEANAALKSFEIQFFICNSVFFFSVMACGWCRIKGRLGVKPFFLVGLKHEDEACSDINTISHLQCPKVVFSISGEISQSGTVQVFLSGLDPFLSLH